jgi:hypothetical protein
MKQTNNSSKLIHAISGLALLAGFFLPWVNWKQTPISGYFLPAGKFFDISGSAFGLSNPMPQMAFSFLVFWLIPVLILVSIALNLSGKKAGWPALIAGTLGLSLVTTFYLFTKTLSDLGIPYRFRPNLYISAIASIIFILSVFPPYNWLKKLGWIIIGPLFVYIGFTIINKMVMNETREGTETLKTDFTVSAPALLSEFMANDSAANKKYREKIIAISGKATEVEVLKDSTVNVKFADSTGSYIILPFEKKFFETTKNMKPGEEVDAKGSCSGSIRSEILGITSISFKFVTLNKK